MDEQHPAWRLKGDPAVIAEALRQTLASLLGMDTSSAPTELAGTASGWSPVRQESELFEEPALGTERPG